MTNVAARIEIEFEFYDFVTITIEISIAPCSFEPLKTVLIDFKTRLIN